MGGQDHTVPEAITRSTLKQYRHSDAVTDLREFPDRGWREVADACLSWLADHGLGASTPELSPTTTAP